MLHSKVLVVASRTVASAALLEAMCQRAWRQPTCFTVLVPGGASLPGGLVDAARARQRAAGLDVELLFGDPDPIMAVRDAWTLAAYDEVLVSTLPSHSSRWLRSGLPFRIQYMTGALVRHVTEDARDVDAVSVAVSRDHVRRPPITAAEPATRATTGRRPLLPAGRH